MSIEKKTSVATAEGTQTDARDLSLWERIRGASVEKRDATENDINTLPQVSDKLPISVYIALAGGASERFAYFALTTPWQNYMQNPRIDHAIPGALNLGQSTATNINNAFLLFSYVTPMGFALLSDLSYGRLKTLKIALASYLAGCLILLCTSLPVALDNGAGVPGLAVAMILVAIGVGGVKATFSPFLGDQYAQKKPRVVLRGDKEVLVTSPLTLQFIYNLFYWLTNIASMSMVPSTFLEFKIEFWTSYLLATASISFTIFLFFLCSPKLRQIPPQGNILPEARRVISCAIKHGFNLDSARHISANENFVDEIRTGLLACRVISCFVFFYLATNQMYNNLVAQAGQMKLSGIPNDMIQVIAGVACIVLGPIMQWLYKFLAKHRIPFGPMLRITLAFVFCALAMTFAAVTQKLIYSTGPCYNRPLACEASDGGRRPNNISVWIQTPTYCLLAIGEILGFVTGSEYAYNKAPPGMKTIVQALVQLSACAAGALGMAISPVAKDPSLVTMYSRLAGAIMFFAFLFWLFFRKWDAKDDELNIRQEEINPVSPMSDGREVEMARN